MGDVLVIGGGMAGGIAALRALSLGAQVRVARRALGATALSSGAVDVATDLTAPPADLASLRMAPLAAAESVARLRPHHPYAVLRPHLPRLGESLSFASAALGGVLGELLPHNALLPTPLGTVKPAAMALKTAAGADVFALPEQVAVVQLDTVPSFDARLVALGVEAAAAALGRTVRATVVRSGLPRQADDVYATPYDLARAFDAPEAANAFAAELLPRLPEGTGCVLLPPVFGGAVQAALGIPCAEVLSGPASVPGLRLQRAIDQALAAAGIALMPAVQTPPPSGATVLATGKYLGGGLARNETFRETVFGLPVYAGAERLGSEFIGDRLGQEPWDGQPAFRAGIRVDPSLRPLAEDGTPARPQLFAAGAVIGGYDPAADKTGLGVAIFTGFLAGEFAARAAGA